jgi:hypothetical protein
MPSSSPSKIDSGQSSSRFGRKKSVSSRPGRRVAKNVPVITTAEFDRRFDAGEDLSDYFDWENPISKAAIEKMLAARKANKRR